MTKERWNPVIPQYVWDIYEKFKSGVDNSDDILMKQYDREKNALQSKFRAALTVLERTYLGKQEIR